MSGNGKTKRLTRVYVEGSLSTDERWELPEETAHYVTRVLRCRAGDRLICFDQDGLEGEFSLLSLEKGQPVRVQAQGSLRPGPNQGSLKIHVACSLSKGAKLDDVVRRVSELGARSFTPLFSERSIPRDIQVEKRLKRWEKIAGEAARQCGRIPMRIGSFMTLDDYTARWGEQSLLLWAGEPSPPQVTQLCQGASSPEDIHVLVGPEGGWSPREVELAVGAKCRLAGLGPRVLRAETAPMAAVAILQAMWGDMR